MSIHLTPTTMKNVGLLIRLEAKPGKEQAVLNFLTGALPLAQQEPATITWYAIQLGPAGRQSSWLTSILLTRWRLTVSC
jgi:hypothetical protein